MSSKRMILAQKPEAIYVDKYGGAEFTVAEITRMVAEMLRTDSPETIDQFLDRFEPQGSPTSTRS